MKGLSNDSDRAATTGSVGTANGSLAITSALSAGPGDIDALPKRPGAENDRAIKCPQPFRQLLCRSVFMLRHQSQSRLGERFANRKRAVFIAAIEVKRTSVRPSAATAVS